METKDIKMILKNAGYMGISVKKLENFGFLFSIKNSINTVEEIKEFCVKTFSNFICAVKYDHKYALENGTGYFKNN